MFQDEKIVETKNCRHCNENFNIYEEDKKMLYFLSPLINGIKFEIPLLKECPTCRRQKRLAWRNTNKLYRRKCDFSGKDIIAFYDETVKHPVYDISIWESDNWNPMSYGKNFDFSKSFFEQLFELKNSVPHFSRSILNFENSDYSNNASNLKNCYLCFNGGNAEDCYYCVSMKDTKNCVDNYSIDDSENCYDCLDVINCNKLFFSQDSKGCFNSYFLKNCIDCKNCFSCKNLVNKAYCIFNKQYSKEEYLVEIKKIFLENNISKLKQKFYNFCFNLPEKYTSLTKFRKYILRFYN